MKKVFFIILLTVFYVTSLFGQVVTKEEYEVYAVVLNHIYKNDGATSLVILEKTKNSDGWEFIDKGTHKDFKKKNRISVQLQTVFPINNKYWVVPKSEIDNLIERGDKEFAKIQEERTLNKQPLYAEPDTEVIWKYFNERFSNAWGYFQFSRVGFNSNKNFAKVEIEYKSDGGFRNIYLLHKRKSKWKIIKTTETEWSH